MTLAAATSSDRAETLFATPSIISRSQTGRQHHPEIDDVVARKRALRRRLARALGAADPGQDLSRRPRQCRCAMDAPSVTAMR